MHKKLAGDFDLFAKQKGINKSKLIFNWIKNEQVSTDEICLHHNSQLKTFNFGLSHWKYELLSARAESSKLSISEFLRQVIEQNIYKRNSSKQTKNKHEVEIANQLEVVKKYRDAGDLIGARSFIYSINPKESLRNYFIKLILESEVELELWNIDKAENILLMIGDSIQSSNFYDLKGHYHFQFGEIFALKEDLINAEIHYQLAEKYFELIGDKYYLVKCYLNLACILSYRLHLNRGEGYLSKVRVLLDKFKDKSLESMYYREVGLYKFIQNDLLTAEGYFMKSLYINQSTRNLKEIAYNFDDLSRVYIVRGEFNKAHKMVKQARDLESNMKRTNRSVRIEMIDVFLESEQRKECKFDFVDNFRPNLARYIYNSTKYIFSKNEKERYDAKSKLLEIPKLNSDYLLIANACRLTVEQGKLFPIR